MAEVSLTDFLLARIAEDETNPRGFGAIPMDLDAEDFPYAPKVPSRILAECEAKRRIIRTCVAWDGDVTPPTVPASGAFGNILATLALPYADHPDYRDEWKP